MSDADEILARALKYKFRDEPIRNRLKDTPGNSQRYPEYAKQYFERWDKTGKIEVVDLNDSDPVWLATSVSHIEKVMIGENTVKLGFYNDDNEWETFSISRAQSMPNEHFVFLEDITTAKPYLKSIEYIFWNHFMSMKGRNWNISEKKLVEKQFDDLFNLLDFTMLKDYDKPQSRIARRLENSMMTIFRGSNIHEGCGITLRYKNNTLDLITEKVDEDEVKWYEGESGLNLKERLDFLIAIHKIRDLQREFRNDNDINFEITLKYKTDPSARKYGFSYKINRL